MAMSAYRRTQQWAVFTRVWYMFDAKWQDPFKAAKKIRQYLAGTNKPIYHPNNDCGDHVVVINSREIALPREEWNLRVFFHHSGFPGGASLTKAYEVHQRDPTNVLRRAVYHSIPHSLRRHTMMCRLHIYPDEEVPKEILDNVCAQIRQLREVPKRLDHYTEEEVKNFPKVFDWPKDYIIK